MAGRQRLLAAAAAGDKDSSHRTAHAIASRLSDPPEVGRRRLTIRRLRPKGADPPLRERWQGPYSHLLVDELQDVDAAQLRLVRILAEPQRNLVVVGDDDQSIYSGRVLADEAEPRWRGHPGPYRDSVWPSPLAPTSRSGMAAPQPAPACLR